MGKFFIGISLIFVFVLMGAWQTKLIAQFDLQPLDFDTTTNSIDSPSESEDYASNPTPSEDPQIFKGRAKTVDYGDSSESGKPWEKLEGCRFFEDAYFDGDSFHVKHLSNEYIFRLYFVDTPESDMEEESRVREQAEYFNITLDQTVEIGHQAAAFTKSQLNGKALTIYTQWLDAKGNSQLPRYFAVVMIEGKNLAQLLVEKGFARIYGARSDIPNLLKAADFGAELRQLEKRAKNNHAGAWRFSTAK